MLLDHLAKELKRKLSQNSKKHSLGFLLKIIFYLSTTVNQ